MNTNTTNTNNSGNPPNFGKSFLNQNKKRKSGYSVPLFGKTGLFISIIAIFVCAVIVFAVSFRTPEKLSKEADSLYDSGKYEEALKKYLKAYNKGYRGDENRIGDMYYNGYGVEKNYFEVVKWYKKSADQGNAWGQNKLGNMYENGYGVDQDDSEAIKWYEKAADQGDETAKSNLKRLTEKIATELSKEADSLYDSGKYKEALKKYLEAYEKGYRGDESRIGYMYDEGKGVVEDDSEAVKWYRKAAEQENAVGQNNLGVMYENGDGVGRSYTEAVRWYRKSAKQGYAAGQYNLGTMYANGYGVDKDEDEAIKWYEKAAAQGNETANNNLKRLKEKKAKEVERQRKAEEAKRKQAIIESLKKGDEIRLGRYPFYEDGSTKEIDWIILEIDSDGDAKLISKYVLDNVMFSSTGSAEPWERSTVMNWLNSDFINKAFNSSEKEFIVGFNFKRGNGEKTNYKVRLLKLYEARKYFNSDSERIAYPTPYAKSSRSKEGGVIVGNKHKLVSLSESDNFETYSCYWLLVDPEQKADCACATHIHPDGSICDENAVNYSGNGVRPVLFIHLDKFFN